MRDEELNKQPGRSSTAVLDFIRGFFRVVVRLAGALIASYLLFCFLNENNAPSSPELTASAVESGIYLAYTQEKGLTCTYLSGEEQKKVSASLLIEGNGVSYASKPFGEVKKAAAGSVTVWELDPAALKYRPADATSGKYTNAGDLIALLPLDATAKIVLTADGETLLTGAPFCPIPFLTGGTHGS